MTEKRIWTIGHSTHTAEHFLELLRFFEIKFVADVRLFPGSKRFPHFNKELLEISLAQNGIQYYHMKELGGRRKPLKDSKNTAWRVEAFRGYADYMETQEFMSAVQQLQKIALKQRTAFMCSEAVWWSCHRSLISDFLKVNGWKVLHILTENRSAEHPYTKAARITDGRLNYESPDLFSQE